MQPILLATDGSPSAKVAAEEAIDLAHALGAPVLIASVWDLEYAPVGYTLGMAPAVPDLDHVGRDRAREVVDEAARLVRKAGLDAHPVVRKGDPVQQLCDLAEEHDVRFVVLGSRGWGSIRRLVFGSVSTGVLHHCKRPVLVIPSPAAADPSSDDRTRAVAEV